MELGKIDIFVCSPVNEQKDTEPSHLQRKRSMSSKVQSFTYMALHFYLFINGVKHFTVLERERHKRDAILSITYSQLSGEVIF